MPRYRWCPFHNRRGFRRLTTSPATLSWLLALTLLAGACAQPPALLRTMEARQRVAELSAHFHKASEATNRAVMADTDDASMALAGEARAASADAQAALDAVAGLVQGLGYQPEVGQVEALSASFSRYRELEERILSLAVENTNLKAQRLSFGTASAQADALVASLTAAASPQAGWQWRARAFEVTSALRELQVLQAPHIAAVDDRVMDRIEERMTAAEARVREGLSAMRASAPSAPTGGSGSAIEAFDAFMATHREILALSRKNTNVRSLALVMNEKGALTREGDQILQQLQQALESHTSYGSR